jgi:hypothetical protein
VEHRVKAWLLSILARIKDGTLLPVSYYASLDCDAALDARDKSGEFDLAWVRACDEVDRRWKDTDLSTELRALAEDIRRESFLVVSRMTGQHEIASHVSDDLDLVVSGRLVGLHDPLLDLLWCDYNRGAFPSPET